MTDARVSIETLSAPADGRDSVAEMRRRVAGTNISDTSLIATDYLNHFNEVVMLIDMIPDMPECLEDAREWRPKSYAQHFADSGLPEADPAIAAYGHSPDDYRLPLESAVENLNRLIESSLDRIAAAIEADDRDALADISARASRNLQRLVEIASAIVNGATSTVDRTEIDGMFER